MVWTKGEDNLKTFLNYINSIYPTIKLTHEYSSSPNQTLPFLDVQLYLNNNRIQSDLHMKPTDRCSKSCFLCCLWFNGVPALKAGAAKRRDHSCYVTSHWQWWVGQGETIENNRVASSLLVIAFNPALTNGASVVRKNLNILQASARCKQTFSSSPPPPHGCLQKKPQSTRSSV